MAKILTDKELADIVRRATHDEGIIDCSDSYTHFVEDLATLVCDHFGGVPGTVSNDFDDLGCTVGIHLNDSVPDDGGVFKDYDTDVSWIDGEERE